MDIQVVTTRTSLNIIETEELILRAQIPNKGAFKFEIRNNVFGLTLYKGHGNTFHVKIKESLLPMVLRKIEELLLEAEGA